MAYNLELAERVRSELSEILFIEKKMFGGVGFLLNGNMACGVNRENLIVRVFPEKHAELLQMPYAIPFDLTGKPMKGWLMVKQKGYETPKQLSAWIKEGVDFALTLPPK